MASTKSPPELIALFESLIPEGDDVERRQMFGYPCCFVRGNMAFGLYQDSFILRLPEGERDRFVKLTGGTLFEPTPGRVMREYVVASKALRQTPAALARWAEEAVAHARALQPRGGRPAVATPARRPMGKGGKPAGKPGGRRGGPAKVTVEIKPHRRVPPKS